jgi:hypothetical protein
MVVHAPVKRGAVRPTHSAVIIRLVRMIQHSEASGIHVRQRLLDTRLRGYDGFF